MMDLIKRSFSGNEHRHQLERRGSRYSLLAKDAPMTSFQDFFGIETPPGKHHEPFMGKGTPVVRPSLSPRRNPFITMPSKELLVIPEREPELKRFSTTPESKWKKPFALFMFNLIALYDLWNGIQGAYSVSHGFVLFWKWLRFIPQGVPMTHLVKLHMYSSFLLMLSFWIPTYMVNHS
jgi:hypothetical protein